MIYGLNFNGTQIPDGVKRKFAAKIKLAGMRRGEYATLQGVATSPEERDQMVVQANNGHRTITVVKRTTAAAPWFGIYIS